MRNSQSKVKERNAATAASPELRRFVAEVRTTLLGLERVLHARKGSFDEMTGLRNDFRLLLDANDRYFHSHSLEAVEDDAIVNSLDTLREQILRWQQHAHS